MKFAGPKQVLEYLGRYTHRVAISNERIKSINNGKVTFTYKNRNDGKIKHMTLKASEFIRHFSCMCFRQVLLKSVTSDSCLTEIRRKAYPLSLINPNVKHLKRTGETLKTIMLKLTGKDITLCPLCKKGNMVRFAEILPMPFNHLQEEI